VTADHCVSAPARAISAPDDSLHIGVMGIADAISARGKSRTLAAQSVPYA